MRPYERKFIPEEPEYEFEKVGNLLDLFKWADDMDKQYSFWKGLVKGFVSFVLFLIPVLLTSFPAYADLTIGGILVILVNWLKFRYNKL
jgi:hypothetical protein